MANGVNIEVMELDTTGSDCDLVTIARQQLSIQHVGRQHDAADCEEGSYRNSPCD